MNKVLLITKNYHPDVDNVIDWIVYNKIEFVRISPSTNFQIKNISIENEKQSVLEIAIKRYK